MSKNFIATFGKEFGLKAGEENRVQLAVGYPDVLVSNLEYTEMVDSLEKSSATLVFRKIMKVLIPDPVVWAERTGSAFLNDFKHIILATLGL